MSLYDYWQSREIAEDYPFYALVMAAMRRADTTDNLAALQQAFPATWVELHARYHAPRGLLPGEEEEELEELEAFEEKSVDDIGDALRDYFNDPDP